MPTLIVEDGSGLATANAYVSEGEVSVYYDAHLYGTAWEAATEPTRAAAIIQATALIDAMMDFDGTPTTTTQALRCPRVGLTNRDGVAYGSATIPVRFKHAVCELIRFLLDSDRAAEPDTAGYSSIQVGALAVSVDTSDRPDLLPDIVRRMLSEFGTVRGGTNAVQMIPVERG